LKLVKVVQYHYPQHYFHFSLLDLKL
jgi:hypothetical protein